MDPREEAWRRLHDPTTSAGDLAAIAGAHSEFADAVARHPNCYPELRVWADEVQRSGVTPPERMSRWRRMSSRALVGVAVGGLVLLGIGATAVAVALATSQDAAPVAQGPSTPATSAATPDGDERRIDGPPIYIGDELAMFLLTPSELAPFVSAASAGQVSSELKVLGESEGASAVPVECGTWVLPDEGAVVGSRSLSWSDMGFTRDSLTVRQFPTADFADAWFSGFADSAEECAQFEFGQIGYSSSPHDLAIVARSGEGDGVLVATLDAADTTEARTVLVGHDGNVVLTIDAGGALSSSDAQRLADLVANRIEHARDTLTEKIGYR